jgi:hypothetical protein
MSSHSKNVDEILNCQPVSSSLREKALGERIKQLIQENDNLTSNFKVMENCYQSENNQLQLDFDYIKLLHDKSIHKNMVLTKLLALYQNKILELVDKTKLILDIKEDNDSNVSRMNVSMKQMDVLIENQKRTIESLELKLLKQKDTIETNTKLVKYYEITNKSLIDKLEAQNDLIDIEKKKYNELDNLFQIKCQNINELQDRLISKDEDIKFLNMTNNNVNNKDKIFNDQIVTRISRTSLLSASTNSLRQSVEKLVKEELAKSIKKKSRIKNINKKSIDNKFAKKHKLKEKSTDKLLAVLSAEKESLALKERKKYVMKSGSLTRFKTKNDENDHQILKVPSKNESLAIAIGIHKDYDPILLDTINF